MPTMYHFWFLKKHPQSIQDPCSHGAHGGKRDKQTITINVPPSPLQTVYLRHCLMQD